jgi:hypothetical protein
MPPNAAPAEGRPKGADAPMHQSREAHHPARPLHSPEGAVWVGSMLTRRRWPGWEDELWNIWGETA